MLGLITPEGETRVTMDVATCSLRYRSISQQHVHRGEASLLEASIYIKAWSLQVANKGDREGTLSMLPG